MRTNYDSTEENQIKRAQIIIGILPNSKNLQKDEFGLRDEFIEKTPASKLMLNEAGFSDEILIGIGTKNHQNLTFLLSKPIQILTLLERKVDSAEIIHFASINDPHGFFALSLSTLTYPKTEGCAFNCVLNMLDAGVPYKDIVNLSRQTTIGTNDHPFFNTLLHPSSDDARKWISKSIANHLEEKASMQGAVAGLFDHINNNTTSSSASKRTSLPTLPLDIGRYIGEYLNIKEGQAVTETCKSAINQANDDREHHTRMIAARRENSNNQQR
jgi:hypothetical protein